MINKKVSATAVALVLALLMLSGCTGSITPQYETDDATPSASESTPVVTESAEPSESPEVSVDPNAQVELTSEEIEWFNTVFFNGDTPNIHNQFLLSLYEKTEDIDLRETFYNGTGSYESASDEERAAIVASNGWESDPDIECTKLSVSGMNDALTENLGLKLDETSGIGLNMLTYMSNYEAYYLYHGDTNYLNVTITDGYRDGLGNFYLNYSCVTFYDSSRVVHLKENGDTYQFVSNTELSGPPGSVTADEDIPQTVIDMSKELVLQWFKEARTQFPSYRYTNWRIESLSYTHTYDDFNGKTLLVYRMNYEYYSEYSDNVQLAGGMTISEDGWVIPGYPDSTYIIFSQDGDALTFLSVLMENDTAPGEELFANDLKEVLGYEPDSLSADTPAGIEVFLDYADDDIVVFHGYFGVCVYDLNACKVVSAVDFIKTLGCSNVNGSVIASVAVSQDGKTVELYLSGVETEMEEMGLDANTAWYLDTESGELTHGVYEQLEAPFTGLIPADQQEAGSYDAVEFPDGMAYIRSAGTTLGDLYYIRAVDMIWPLF